ncbi:DUF1289 domain-containing protein [Stakelama pacifica]|uniref:DUF1289 domain-containing protein n=1 Tax=Stakelama pacifica TaxID=517720 RepID=UPI001060E169|nr:DUF1289 domain-containing protein [Stakelama pacifica]
MEDDFISIEPAAQVANPCVGICRIDPDSDLCRGCARTLDEISRWSTVDDAGRQAILDRIAARTA